MRAVVLSDSHGDTSACKRAVKTIGKVDLIIHLGDIARDCRFLETEFYPIPVVSVVGNNDLMIGDTQKVVEFDGHRLFICHGHTFGVHTSYDRLVRAARENNCEIALFGHTHRSVYTKQDDILLVNPGSVSRPRAGEPSFAVIETEGAKLEALVVDWVL